MKLLVVFFIEKMTEKARVEKKSIKFFDFYKEGSNGCANLYS